MNEDQTCKTATNDNHCITGFWLGTNIHTECGGVKHVTKIAKRAANMILNEYDIRKVLNFKEN